MALGGEMHDGVGIVGRENLPQGGGIADIGAEQDMTRMVPAFLQRVFGRRVGHLVDVDDRMSGRTQQMAHHGGSDESAAAGQQNLHRGTDFRSGCTAARVYHLPRGRLNRSLATVRET